jgi:hypothetical protein
MINYYDKAEKYLTNEEKLDTMVWNCRILELEGYRRSGNESKKRNG